MINTDEALNAFKKKFESMSYKERESYLKDMGFSFGKAPDRNKIRTARLRKYYQLKDKRGIGARAISHMVKNGKIPVKTTMHVKSEE